MKNKKKFKTMYEPAITYDIRWIQMYLKDKYAKEYSELRDRSLENPRGDTK